MPVRKGAKKGKKATPAKVKTVVPVKESDEESLFEEADASEDEGPPAKKEKVASKSKQDSGSAKSKGQSKQADLSESEDEKDATNEDDQAEGSEVESPPSKKGKVAAKGKAGSSTKKSKNKGKGKSKPKPSESKKKVEPTSGSEEDEDPDAEYEVERILDVQVHRNNTREFLVKWVGYPRSKSTWEPEANLDCPDKLEAFTKKLDTLKDVSTKTLRTQRKQTQPYQDSVRNAGATYHGQDSQED